MSHHMLTVFRPRSFCHKRTLFDLSGSRTYQTHKVKRKINTDPDSLYSIIADVSRYSEFVPFVTHSFVNSYDPVTRLPTEAGFRVGWKQYDENFMCKLKCGNKKVIADSISISLFECLHNEWHLKEVKSRFTHEMSTLVELSLKYKFKNPIYNSIASLFQDQVSSIMIKAFEDRALQLKAKGN